MYFLSIGPRPRKAILSKPKKNSKMLGNSYGPFSTGVIVIDHRKLSLFWSARVLITPCHELLLEIDGCIQVVILFA